MAEVTSESIAFPVAAKDALNDILKQGAQQMLAQADLFAHPVCFSGKMLPDQFGRPDTYDEFVDRRRVTPKARDLNSMS